MNVPVVLFDLDGTLSNSAAGIVASCRYALGDLGLEVDDAAVRPWIGLGLHQVMGVLGVPEGQLDRAVAAYRAYYSTTGIYQCQLFDGVPAMLSALKGAGKTLGVATAKATPLAEEVLRYLGIAPYFDMVEGAALDGTSVSKGDIVACALGHLGGPGPQTVALAGDRSYDIVGAIENGARPIGVAWGYGTVEELLSAGAEVVARDPVELARLLLAGSSGQDGPVL